MSTPGGPAPMSPEAAARLRAHVAAILDAAAVPPTVRDDVAEELYGHLAERAASYRSRGLDEGVAVERAIADFGGVDQLGRDFGRTYHSRLWASTIGILLPAVAPRAERPGAVGWLRLTIGVAVAVTAIGLPVGLSQLTPVRALGTLVLEAIGLWVMVLAFTALGRGQRWALWYGLAVAMVMLAAGIGSVLATPPGSLTIPLGAILAGLALLVAYGDRQRLQAYVASSRPIGRLLAAALALALLLPLIVPPVLLALPDPTQAESSDLVLEASMVCDRGDVTLDIGPVARDVQRVTLVADMTWQRGDFLPMGLAGLFHQSDYGDSAGFRILDAAPDAPIPAWLLASNEVPVVDVATGEQAGWFGSTAPSVELLPDTIGSFTIGIDSSAIRAGHTLRATWLLSPTTDADAAWPRIEVAYAHLDRFLLVAAVSCGETVRGYQVPLRSPGDEPILTDPFGLPSTYEIQNW